MEVDPDTEAIATIGAKEGLSHLVLATISPGDVVFAPEMQVWSPLSASSMLII